MRRSYASGTHKGNRSRVIGGTARRFNKLAWQVAFLILAMLGASFLNACGGSGGGSGTTTTGNGGGGDTSVAALLLPNRVELTKAGSDGDDTARAFRAFRGADAATYNAAGTDYNAQERQSWTEDLTGAMDLINEILEIVQDTGYDQMVNQGPYVALVNDPDSRGDQGGGEGGGTSTATTTEALREMTVNVTRDDDSAPMYVQFWMDMEDGPGGMPMRVKGLFEVTESVSDTYPLGEMLAHFIGVQLSGGTEVADAEPMMRIAMQIGSDENENATVQFVERSAETYDGHSFSMSTELNVVADGADLESGQAYVHELATFDGMEDEAEMLIRFNTDFVKVQEDGETEVYDKNDYDHEVYRYKLFTADDGAEVEINSGFPVRFADGMHGYVGYYGVWMNDPEADVDGETVTREGTEDQYTVVQKGGKLMMHTRASTTLADLAGVEFGKWDHESNLELVVTWDTDSQRFIAIGMRGEETDWMTERFDDQHELYHAEVSFNEWDGAWCESLRAFMPIGQLYRTEDPGYTAPTNDSVLYYHAEKMVVPGSSDFPTGELTLYYHGPAPGSDNWETASMQTFVFDPETLMLYDENDEPVEYVAGDNANDWGNWHLQPLTTEMPEEHGNPWEERVFYSWQTGQDEWNKLTVLQDAEGSFMAFDAPLRLSFEVGEGYDWNNDDHAGQTFGTEYDGFSLHLPWEPADEDDDGEEGDDGGMGGEWRPVLNLRDSHDSGLVLTDMDENEYVLKGVEEELEFNEVAEADWTAAMHALEIVDVDPPTVGVSLNADIEEIFGGDADWDWTKPTAVELEVIKGELIDAE